MKYSLEKLGILDAPADSTFDNFTKLACSMLGTSVSLITIIDFEKDRQFFKSQVGLDGELAEHRQTPLSHSICQHVVNDNATLVVDDTALHEKVKDHPAVRDLGVATYLGAPIHSPESKPIGAFCVIDFESRQWTQEETEQLERLARCIADAIKLKSAYLDSEAARNEQADFAHAISHELKAPGCTLQMLLEEIALEGDNLSNDVQMLVNNGLGTVTRMRKQLDDVLEYSQTTHMDGILEPISLEQLMKELLMDLHGDITKSAAAIHCEALPLIMGNRMQVRALFQNLVSNSLKFTAPERELAVTITTTYDASVDQHCIMISDNGVGIAPENQASIFGLFSRSHSKKQYAGSGIGLALCHRVMKNHQGSIEVASNGHDGTTFTVKFPDRQLPA